MGLHRYALALAFALSGGGALAQSVAVQDSAFQRFLLNTTGVGQQTVGFGTGGQPLPQPSGFTLAGDGGSGLKASGTGVLRNPSGGSIPVAVTGRVTPSVMGSLVARAVPLLTVATVGIALYDYAKELGYNLSVGPGGSISVTKTDPTQCTSAPCYGPVSSRLFSTAVAACTAYAATVANGRPITNLVTYYETSTTFHCDFRAGAQNYSQLIGKTNSVPAPSPAQPSSVSELSTAVASQTSVPLSSSAARAIDQARQLLSEPIPLAQPEVTGPASSPGSTSTSTKPDGSTVTITQTYNHTYTGPTINTTTTTVTSTVPAGGGPVQTETTVQTPDPVQQEPEPFVMPCGVSGSPPCAVKVDETGVPTTVEELSDPQDMADQSIAPIVGVQAETFWPSLPQVSFDFALPTACSPLSIPAFSPFLEQIDVCEFQPMFHSIMELVWVLGALFGAIGLFWRNSMNPVPA